MVQIDITRIAEEEQKAPEFQQELADFQMRFYALEKDPREKFRLCLHEAGHIVFNRRLGWEVGNFRGPHMYRDKDGVVRRALGSVTPVGDVSKVEDFIAVIKADIAGFVLVGALTGESDSKTAIKNDMRILTSIEASKEAIETATQEIFSELDNDGFMFELIGAVREYENTVFGTDDTWRWGWKEYRLDLPGQRYSVGGGNGWLLIEHENQLRFIVRVGRELLPNDENFQYMVVAPPVGSGERATDAVRRWNEQVQAATAAGGSNGDGIKSANLLKH